MGGDQLWLGRSKHKCQVQPQVKKRPPSTAARPGACDQAHSPRPSISFPGTNYPDVRDLTHKLRTAGEFSGSNHTSVLLAPNNPQCLTHPPPSPPDSVLITSQRWLLAVAPSLRAPPEKNQPTLARETGARLMISSRNCHQLLFFFFDVSFLLSKGWNERTVLSWKADDLPSNEPRRVAGIAKISRLRIANIHV